jgi:hypothetical protein
MMCLLVVYRWQVSKCQENGRRKLLSVFLTSTTCPATAASSTTCAALRLELLETSFSDLEGQLLTLFNSG